MKSYLQLPIISSFLFGIVTAVAVFTITTGAHENWLTTEQGTQEHVHVHADFAVYLDHEKQTYTDDRYQSHQGAVKHPSLHLHSNDDHVVHRHADGVTMGDFFTSLGYRVSNTELTTDSGTVYQNSGTEQLLFFVNGQIHEDFINYIFQDEDQLLLYFGDPDDPRIETYLESITDEACIYSGTCPERGVAPPSDCGITCDVYDAQSVSRSSRTGSRDENQTA